MRPQGKALLFRAAAAALFVVSAACTAQTTAKQFMVAAAHPLAADAGVAVLKVGGSAVDAAIAAQLVLGLVEPESSGIGGGAFLLHWSEKEKRVRAYDGRETAPMAARADRFLGTDGKPLGFFEAAVGGRSVGAPGVLRMLELAHARHGRLPWRELFQQAIRIAEEGFALSPRLHAILENEKFLPENPDAARLFYDEEKQAKPAGARIVNRDYGATLREIAARGASAFYTGPIAEDIVRAVRGNARAGDLAAADLARYRPIEREPVCGAYRAWRLCGMGPPSSGGVAVLQILGILERTDFHRAAPGSAQAWHLFAEAGKLAYADRARFVGDPDFVAVPLGLLLGKRYLDARAKTIGERAMRTVPAGDNEAPGTSHLSIVDADGDAVALTTTIESPFGSRIMVRGFLLNNELTDFDFVPGGANQVEPGKRPRSSMAPTFVFDADGTLRMALGSPGGGRIINYVAKTLVAALDWGMNVQAAIDAPNIGSRNGPLELEEDAVDPALRRALESRGHAVEEKPLVSGVQAIERIFGGWRGGADRRREGVARGE
jgi:gamma-glutamyltranspeptidase/glutathione hydrolase